MSNLAIIDKDTGSVLFDLTGYHLVKDRDSHTLIEFKQSNDNFVKVFPEAIPAIYKVLKPSEINFFFCCTQFLSYNDCALREGGHGNGKILTPVDLADCTDYSVTRVHHILSSLYAAGLADRISLDSTDRLAVVLNPFCVFKGAKIMVKVYNHFIYRQKKV